MEFVRIPKGVFLMGSPEDEEDRFDNEGPRHQVEITRPFYLGKYEVTREQFQRFVADDTYRTEAEKDGLGGAGWNRAKKSFERSKDYTWKDVGFPQTDNDPVVNVTWNDADRFCDWLKQKSGKAVRLPTEAEWEYACRAGTTTRFYSGNDAETLAEVGNLADGTFKKQFPKETAIEAEDGYVFTAPMGRFKPNKIGLFDMHGNVWEWCQDWYDEGYYANSPRRDPQGPNNGTHRVLRGGTWYTPPRYCRAAYRGGETPASCNDDHGFRVEFGLD
jgi:formylglycine-generating enzyme required for sulfatase activity